MAGEAVAIESGVMAAWMPAPGELHVIFHISKAPWESKAETITKR